MIKDKRLKIFSDIYFENSFMVSTSELTFARINKIENLWCVWFYTKHLQRNFKKLKEALNNIQEEFVKFVKCDTQKNFKQMYVQI